MTRRVGEKGMLGSSHKDTSESDLGVHLILPQRLQDPVTAANVKEDK